MNESEIQKAIGEVLRTHCNVTVPIQPESRLAEDLGLDSVGLLTMAVEVENYFQTALGEEPEHPPRTVADVVALIQRRLIERAPSQGGLA
jgi:acyl carrier protein